jgi:3',5'-cyclic AMP phosphodiesterase CpdA
VVLDTCRPLIALPTGFYAEGAIDPAQLAFLDRELAAAEARDHLVVVVTHHPSASLDWRHGSVIGADAFRGMLSRYPGVVAHLAGHNHRHRVWDYGGYVEFETASTLDYPQEGRVLELWKGDGAVELRYQVFSHLPELNDKPELGLAKPDDDPRLPMRRVAYEASAAHVGAAPKRHDAGSESAGKGIDALGAPRDRTGTVRLSR